MSTLLALSWVELSPDIFMRRQTRCSVTTHAEKAESSAGAWRCSATVRGLVAKEVDCSRLQGRTPRSSAGQWKSELWAREGFQSLQSAIDAFPRLKWPECTDRQGNAALCRVDISTPELLSWRWCTLQRRRVMQHSMIQWGTLCYANKQTIPTLKLTTKYGEKLMNTRNQKVKNGNERRIQSKNSAENEIISCRCSL